jgi:hypothetical protein
MVFAAQSIAAYPDCSLALLAVRNTAHDKENAHDEKEEEAGHDDLLGTTPMETESADEAAVAGQVRVGVTQRARSVNPATS